MVLQNRDEQVILFRINNLHLKLALQQTDGRPATNVNSRSCQIDGSPAAQFLVQFPGRAQRTCSCSRSLTLVSNGSRLSWRTSYQVSFLVHYLELLVYPNISETLMTWLGSGVLLVQFGHLMEYAF